MTDDGVQLRNRSGIGLQNRHAVLQETVPSGPLPRAELAVRIGVSQPAVSRITRGLLDEGLLRELPERRAGADASRTGRREVPLDIDPQGGYVLGIGIGPTFQTVTVADLGNDVVEGGRLSAGGNGWLKPPGEDGAPATLDDLASGLGILRRLHGEDVKPVRRPCRRWPGPFSRRSSGSAGATLRSLP